MTSSQTSKKSAKSSPKKSGDSLKRLSAEQRQAIARVLADPRRFEILEQIAAHNSLLCGQLHVQESLSPATISHHLRELQEAGLVDVERQGRQMCLSLRREVWDAYVQSLQRL